MSEKLIHAEISRKELQIMAESVKALQASGRINADQRRRFMQAIMAGDSQGNLWTTGTQTGKWYKQIGNKWLEGQPPEQLLLFVPQKAFREAEIQLDELKFEFDIKAFRANRCPKCGSEFAVGAHFCIICGASVTETQRLEPLPTPREIKCPGCGQVVAGNPNFCIKCGKKLH